MKPRKMGTPQLPDLCFMSNSLNYKTWLEMNLLLWYIAEKFNISTNDILSL